MDVIVGGVARAFSGFIGYEPPVPLLAVDEATGLVFAGYSGRLGKLVPHWRLPGNPLLPDGSRPPSTAFDQGRAVVVSGVVHEFSTAYGYDPEMRRGAARADGYLFAGYSKSRSGVLRPKWLSPDAFDRDRESRKKAASNHKKRNRARLNDLASRKSPGTARPPLRISDHGMTPEQYEALTPEQKALLAKM